MRLNRQRQETDEMLEIYENLDEPLMNQLRSTQQELANKTTECEPSLLLISLLTTHHSHTTDKCKTRMWANAQRYGLPAEYRTVALSVQRHKVWLMPTTGVPCSNAAKMRNRSKLAGVPQTTDRSQPPVGRSSPYCGDIWRRHCSDCTGLDSRPALSVLPLKTAVFLLHVDRGLRVCALV